MKRTLEERLWDNVDRDDRMYCWEWKGPRLTSGYGIIYNPGGTRYAHRVMAGVYCGVEIPRDKVVLHVCDNTSCCNPYHLIVGTTSDNMRDMHTKGRATGKQARPSKADDQDGERNSMCKLTSEQVSEIRRRWQEGGILQRELAAEFGTSQPHISSIVKNKIRRIA